MPKPGCPKFCVPGFGQCDECDGECYAGVCKYN